ncbi:hypothetical protein [Thalassovita mangrovi]|uniref:Uncharacterized protein n=1 Tax=Thalassovita mangrovi TaxID=2692236 RepID=A0A6L8LWL7_9RHOB|nr:hypothetical protein [Thalassovita mangrovi]MYM57559.1 hypothetical protein [Thalassovita mangrovi]
MGGNLYRRLIDMKEALGSFKGRFLVRLEQHDEVWVPTREQDFRNVFHDFDEVADVGFTGVEPDRLAGLAGLGAQLGPLVPGPGQTKLQHGFSVAIYFPASDAYISIGNGQIKAFDISSGDELGMAGARVDVPKYFPSTNAVYLADWAELLIAAENGYFILKDDLVDSASACW